MDEVQGQPRGDVCGLLRSVILQICKEHYQACGDVEVDAIICLSTLNSESQDVVKIHKILPSSNFKNRQKRLANPPFEQLQISQDNIPIHFSKESDSANFQVKEEVDIEFIAQQNDAHSDGDEFKSETGEDQKCRRFSLDHPYNENPSAIEMDQNHFISNREEETEVTEPADSHYIVIKEEHPPGSRPPNYSSRPKRKQNPKKIVRVQYFQNSSEKDPAILDNEAEDSFPDETVNESEYMSQKCEVDESEDGVESEAAYSVDEKPLFNYVDSEIDLNLMTETEASPPEVEVVEPSPENRQSEKVSRHRNKKISLNLIHNKSKIFKCRKCGSGFSSKKSQMRHERYNCGDIPHFECSVCGKFYSRADSKTRHLWKIHGIKISTPDKSNPMEFP